MKILKITRDIFHLNLSQFTLKKRLKDCFILKAMKLKFNLFGLYLIGQLDCGH